MDKKNSTHNNNRLLPKATNINKAMSTIPPPPIITSFHWISLLTLYFTQKNNHHYVFYNLSTSFFLLLFLSSFSFTVYINTNIHTPCFVWFYMLILFLYS